MAHLQANDMGHTSRDFVHCCSHTMVGRRLHTGEKDRIDLHAFGRCEVCIVWPGL